MKKFMAMLLVAILVFALVGCGSQKREIVKLTLSTEDSEAILAAAGITLPDVADVAAAGSTVKWFSWDDPFHNYAEDEIVNTGFWTFQEKYGCDVEWVECTYSGYTDDLANLILSGNAPDFTRSGAGVYPYYSVSGMFAPVNDYIDYDDPLWSGLKEFVLSYCAIGDKIYSMCTDVEFGNVCAYNRRVVDEWGFDDPAELYYNDEWTWDVFYEMCVDFSDPDDDRYALDGWSYTEGIMDSSGAELVFYNMDTSRFEVNVDDPRLERAANLLYDLAKNQCIFPWWDNGWSLRNGVEGGGIKEGLCLFHIRGTYVFTAPVEEVNQVWGDIEAGELMFVPLPRDNNGDGEYYLNAAPNGYALVKGGTNHEGAALLASCERFKILDPTVISIDKKQLIETYCWTDEMLAMWDTCYDIANKSDAVIFDYNYGDRINSYISQFIDTYRYAEPTTWAQSKESYTEPLQYYVDALNEEIAALEAEQ